MKIIIFVALLLVLPGSAPAHPGKTDKYGGHKCLRSCEDWKLYYSEYHLHDKDGKPIRVARKPKNREEVELITTASETMLPQTELPKTIQTVTVYQYVNTVREETRSEHPLLWVLLVLLMLLLILRLNRKKPQADR